MKQVATVYVVDDEEPIRNAFEVLLRGRAMEVRTFSSAEAFLHAYADDWVGVLLVDARMPDMDGSALCRELERRNSSLRIILMTGDEDADSLTAALGGGVRMLEKPFKAEEVVNSLLASGMFSRPT